jgi:hypothetical protein
MGIRLIPIIFVSLTGAYAFAAHGNLWSAEGDANLARSHCAI